MIGPIVRPFTPDGAKDLGSIWERQQHPPQAMKLAKPNALMFFHIPLCVSSSRGFVRLILSSQPGIFVDAGQ